MKAKHSKKSLLFLLFTLFLNYSSQAQEDWVISPSFQEIYPFSEGIALVKGKAGKLQQESDFYGAIDTKGKLLWVLPENLAYVHDDYEDFGFQEGLTIVRDKETELRGYVNTKGKLVIPCQFSAAGAFSEGLAWIQNEDLKFGFINNKGKIVIAPQYDESGKFSQGLCAVANMVDEENYILKWGYIDTQGEEVIPFRESYYGSPFNENGLAFFTFIGKTTDGTSMEGSSQIIDRQGNIVNPFLNYIAYDFNEDGLLAVGKKVPYEWEGGYSGFTTKVGFANEKGELVIPYTFDTYGMMEAPPVFSEGMAAVGQMQEDEYSTMKYGFINTNGEVVVDFQYDYVMPFQSGLAQVSKYDENSVTYFINSQGEKIIEFSGEEDKDYYYQGFEKSYCIIENYTDSNAANVMDTQGNFIFDRWYEYIQFLGEDVVACQVKGLWGVKKLNNN